MLLHTVNKSPFEKGSLDTCLRLAKQGSTILLIEDAVYAAMQGTAIASKIAETIKRYSVYALRSDLKARGLEEDRLLNGIKVVDYDGFVDLVTEHDTVQSWF